MDYTVLRNTMRHVTHGQNCSFRELTGANSTVNLAKEERAPKTKTPSITMGFCILGGYISGFEVRLQRAVMPCD
jgi:hypothetical protein